MTEYSDRVAAEHNQRKAEEWGKQIKFVHYNNGIEETRFNSGKANFINRNSGKRWTIYPDNAKLSLLERFEKWIVDRQAGVAE